MSNTESQPNNSVARIPSEEDINRIYKVTHIIAELLNLNTIPITDGVTAMVHLIAAICAKSASPEQFEEVMKALSDIYAHERDQPSI